MWMHEHLCINNTSIVVSESLCARVNIVFAVYIQNSHVYIIILICTRRKRCGRPVCVGILNISIEISIPTIPYKDFHIL